MRILGLDYGSKTVGVAVCDPLGITAQGVETITRRDEDKLRKTLARIEDVYKRQPWANPERHTISGKTF